MAQTGAPVPRWASTQRVSLWEPWGQGCASSSSLHAASIRRHPASAESRVSVPGHQGLSRVPHKPPPSPGRKVTHAANLGQPGTGPPRTACRLLGNNTVCYETQRKRTVGDTVPLSITPILDINHLGMRPAALSRTAPVPRSTPQAGVMARAR